MLEDTGKVLFGDAGAVVVHLDAEMPVLRLRLSYTYSKNPVVSTTIGQGVLCVANEVYQNLEDLMVVEQSRGHVREFTFYFHAVPG
jgi:hypothetical protein